MSAIAFQAVRPMYDVEETAHAFQARQRAAYLAGKATWRDGRISGQALQLYDELVRYVGANRFCWVKEETLADLLHRSVSTIKRWMQQLVDVHLIRRDRRFGLSSLTAITAYDTGADSAQAGQEVATPSAPTNQPARRLPASDGDGGAAPAGIDAHRLPATADGFFPSADEPSISSFLDPHTLKNPMKHLGGGISERTETTEPAGEIATITR
ncbi:MAG: hypothetical protein H0X37_16535, partial [Herpetosiphonaceae bacterium]|nr:hypothetical protein [Herpetosiphonaceae bacterium]